MKRNTLFSFLAIAALGLLTAGPANAADDAYTWVGGAGVGSERTQWDYLNISNEYENWTWDAGGNVTVLPNSGDTVVIRNVTHQPILAVAATLSDLTIDVNADMKVSGVKLTLPTSGTTAYDNFNGDLILSDSGAIVLFSANVTINGSGGIVGQDDSAELWITGGKTLTNETTVSGKMKVMTATGGGGVGNGVFDNRHVVLADANGTLEFADELDIDDDSGASWQAKTNSGALLKFSSDDPDFCLQGDFLIDNCATIELAAGVVIKTEGGLTQTAGTLTVGGGGAAFAELCNPTCTSCTGVTPSTVGCS